MPSKVKEATSRGFHPMPVPGLSTEAQEAVNTLFESMSAWRQGAVDANQKNNRLVLERMAAAAAALGWPQQVVDAARVQVQSITDMQIKTMDHIMNAWEQQLKRPNPMSASPSDILSQLQSAPAFGAGGVWPGSDALPNAATAPVQLWMEFGKQWQKFWSDTMTQWAEAARKHDQSGPR